MRIKTLLFFPFLQKIKPRLLPISGLEHIKKDEWSAIDYDPQFDVRSPFLRLLCGPVSISVVLYSRETLHPKLYFDFGEGFSEARSAKLLHLENDLYRTEIILPACIKRVRFDPNEAICSFRLASFQIRAHSKPLHILHQFASVARYDHHSNAETLRIFKKSYARYRKHGLSGMLERLDKEYRNLHPKKIQRATPKHSTYMNWIKHHEEKSETDEVTQLSRMPLISVVMSTYNTPTHYLQKAIQSVLTQSYPHWELCIADDASDNKETLQLLRSYQKESDKIHIQFRRENGHISAASNTALKMAQGEFIALMDHDDMLAPHALLEAVKAINQYPHAKLLYSDEDKIDEKGRRYDPHFKTEWNPDLFFSQNYLSHLTIMRKELFEQLGGFRSGYEGAQDYDLLLRSLDYLEEYEIIHIPGILYHWRAIEGSSALNSAEKPYTSEAGLLALKDYLYKRYPDTEVKLGMVPNTYKVVYPLQRVPLISLIIPTRDSYAILHKCIQSILEKTRYKNYEIIIIDNQTKDLKTLDYFKQLRSRYPIIRIVSYDKPFNYAAMNNFGATQARGELLGLINNDIEVISEEWLNEMVQHALRPGIGAVGAKLYYDDGTIQHAGVILGIGGVAGHSHKYFHRNDDGYFSRLKIIQNLSAVTSACLILRKKLYLEVGGMDAVYLKVAFNDVDLCLKIRQLGYRNLWTPYARLYHHESLSRGAEDTKEKKIRFAREVAFMQKKWGAQLQTDPYYSQYLTLRHEDFTIDPGHHPKKS